MRHWYARGSAADNTAGETIKRLKNMRLNVLWVTKVSLREC
jgi:hypothetical protein